MHPATKKKSPSKEIGSGGWTRTSDQVVNSHLLYQLSYAGTERSPCPERHERAIK